MSTQHHQATFTQLCYTSKYHRINRHNGINTSWRVWIPEQTISVQNCSTLAIVCQLSVPKLKMPQDKGRHTLTAREWPGHSARMPCLWAAVLQNEPGYTGLLNRVNSGLSIYAGRIRWTSINILQYTVYWKILSIKSISLHKTSMK